MDSDYADWALQSDPPPTNAPSPPVHTGAPVSDDDSAADSAEDRAIAGFKCTEDQRKWIIDEHYGDYLTHKRRRGSRNGPNAKTFSYELVYTFEAQFFSSWPETKRVKYRSKIQSVRACLSLIVYSPLTGCLLKFLLTWGGRLCDSGMLVCNIHRR